MQCTVQPCISHPVSPVAVCNPAKYNYSFIICYMGNSAFQPVRHKTLINNITGCVDRIILKLIFFSVG